MKNSRWPKHKVVKWLELGAVPALIGLWFPNWAEGYIQWFSNGIDKGLLAVAFPPLLAYVGVLILYKASTEGIKNMGTHYKGAIWAGRISVVFAILSIITHFFIQKNMVFFGMLTILSIGLAAFFEAIFLWFTIAKVAEISAERRTRITRDVVLLISIAALISCITAVVYIYQQNHLFPFFLRLSVILFTVAFVFCRYGVFCYKTQKSIGANFTKPPEDQFWI